MIWSLLDSVVDRAVGPKSIYFPSNDHLLCIDYSDYFCINSRDVFYHNISAIKLNLIVDVKPYIAFDNGLTYPSDDGIWRACNATYKYHTYVAFTFCVPICYCGSILCIYSTSVIR
nr:MAG TPA: hypothetical protein [Caudoviricetes sp.]